MPSKQKPEASIVLIVKSTSDKSSLYARSGRLWLYVLIAGSQLSYPASTLYPALRKPRDRPPQPANRSITEGPSGSGSL